MGGHYGATFAGFLPGIGLAARIAGASSDSFQEWLYKSFYGELAVGIKDFEKE
jgi:hypothetical protein